MNNVMHLCCPRCKGGLIVKELSINCNSCNQVFTIKDGIFDFSNDGLIFPPECLNWQSFIQKYLPGCKSEPNFLNTIIEFTDESINSFRTLIPNISKAHILYIGHNNNEIIQNLAVYSKKVTALFFSKEHLVIQHNKSGLRHTPRNIEFIFADKSKILPFIDETFDGVILDRVIEELFVNAHEIQPQEHLFMSELNRSLKTKGWLFQKSENRFSKLVLLDVIRSFKSCLSFFSYKSIDQKQIDNKVGCHLRSVNGYKKHLKSNGFLPLKVWGMDNSQKTIDNLIDLSNKSQITDFLKNSRFPFNRLPPWLYRLVIPTVGILATKSDAVLSVLDIIIAQILKHLELSSNEINISSCLVNRKCKCVVVIDLLTDPGNKIILKIPIDKISDNHLEHNYLGLEYIQSHYLKGKSKQIIGKLFPKPIMRGGYDGIPYYVESSISGNPWIANQSLDVCNSISQYLIELANISELNFKPKSNDIGLINKIIYIKEFVEKHSMNMSKDFSSVTLEIVRLELINNTPRYFYKSDFSVSNILVENGEVNGIIDMDFWGTSHNKLVDYADFIQSYTRNFCSFSQSQILSALHTKDLSLFPKVLNIEKTLQLLNSSAEELKNAALIAWVNGVFHAIEFKKTNLNKYQLERILFEPLKCMLL